MIKYAFSLFLILTSVTVLAQKKSVVNLIRSKSSEGVKINGKDVIKVYQGTFQQDFSIMRSDSAYFYAQDNAFDAFGNVNITQGDTLNIFADKLNYNGNTKVAILTDNVKMVDKDATLTTNYLTYNTATRIGTYTGGGKVVNKDNTLTSKNGYYFALSRDSYFRYDVVLVTPDALIKTDTLRYNTGTRIAFFYGPTNIYDTKDKKDTLYTENGLYNTVVEQAFFGKKNLYKSGTKRLKGDSLFYDKKNGFGRAVKHVVFTDSEQKTTLMGDLANYYKSEERTVVTEDPYVIIVTEEKDTTKSDTIAVPIVNGKPEIVKKGSPIIAPSLGTVKTNLRNSPVKAPPLTAPIKTPLGTPIDAKNKLRAATDSLAKLAKVAKADTSIKTDSLVKVKKPEKIKRDSIYISADTLITQMLTYKDLKALFKKQRLAGIRDTSLKVKGAGLATSSTKTLSKFLSAVSKGVPRDSLIWHPLQFGLPKPEPVAVIPPKLDKKGRPIKEKKTPTLPVVIVPDKLDKDGIRIPKKPQQKEPVADPEDNDPAFIVKTRPVSDTARIRIIRAYHHAKLFKSDLQAKADSMFYSYSDSTLRCFVNPLIWTQGSQLSGDTITMQMRNKKMDNLMLFPSAFIVNIEKDDSLTFNQIAGKRMRGFFKNDKLDKMFISGNAESIYFARDSTKKVTEMQRSLSTRMRVVFKDNAASDVFFITKPDHRYGPLVKFQEDEKILKGFIWKPKERPISKESIIPSYTKKQLAKQSAAAPGKKGAKTPSIKLINGKPAPIDSAATKLPAGGLIKAGKDSLNVKPVIKDKADSTMLKPASAPAPSPKRYTPVTKPVVKPKAGSAVKNP
ncbi:OstA-like protein [Mucilaginibacter gilvus]|uniref:OstA-like protein n=1 Tax=Mucilaginibacter gilvus TaxID=2305909 RepID=UPI0014193B82|nr:OstA-like protein [Mucilaginibacter gilvus]